MPIFDLFYWEKSTVYFATLFINHDIMELEAHREALRVETLKMNEVLRQPANLHYLHPKHYKPYEAVGGTITQLRNGRYRATRSFQHANCTETFDTKAECEKWLNNLVISQSSDKKGKKLAKTFNTKVERQGRQVADDKTSSNMPLEPSRIPNSTRNYLKNIEALQNNMSMDGEANFIE